MLSTEQNLITVRRKKKRIRNHPEQPVIQRRDAHGSKTRTKRKYNTTEINIFGVIHPLPTFRLKKPIFF